MAPASIDPNVPDLQRDLKKNWISALAGISREV
jgi:hypothetical protein